MSTWRVTIKATVIKTYEVEANTEDAAVEEAHGIFAEDNDYTEDNYNEETLSVEKANARGRSRSRRRR